MYAKNIRSRDVHFRVFPLLETKFSSLDADKIKYRHWEALKKGSINRNDTDHWMWKTRVRVGRGGVVSILHHPHFTLLIFHTRDERLVVCGVKGGEWIVYEKRDSRYTLGYRIIRVSKGVTVVWAYYIDVVGEDDDDDDYSIRFTSTFYRQRILSSFCILIPDFPAHILFPLYTPNVS